MTAPNQSATLFEEFPLPSRYGKINPNHRNSRLHTLNHRRSGNNRTLLATEEDVPSQYVHPRTRQLYRRFPFIERIPMFNTSIEAFGPKCVISFILCYFFLKGIADQLIANSVYPIFINRYKSSADDYQRYSTMHSLGWSLKALVAMNCDIVSLFYYTKKYYMLFSCIIGGSVAFGYGFLPQNKPSSAEAASVFLFLTNFFKANVDILSEGYYSRLLREYPDAGSALVSVIWWGVMTGTIIAAIILGPLTDVGLPEVAVAIAAVIQILCALIFVFNGYEEKKNSIEREEDARALFKEEYSVAMGIPCNEPLASLTSLPPQALQDTSNAATRQPRMSSTGILISEAPGANRKDLHPEIDSSNEAMTDSLTELSNAGQGGVLARVLKTDLNGNTNAGNIALMLNSSSERSDTEMRFLAQYVPPRSYCNGYIEINADVYTRNRRIFFYCIVMTLSVIAVTIVDVIGSTFALLYTCIAVSIICMGMSFYALPIIIAKANVYNYLQKLLYINLPGALDTFYMATPECLEGGPHFSYFFYNTVSAIIGNVGGLCGVTAFHYVFSKRTYRLAFVVTTFIQVFASIFDLIIVKRWNRRINIPDKAMYILGDGIVYQVCYMLGWMPMIILLSRLCPRGSESMVYALTSGFGNFGQSMSNNIGSLLMELVWPVVTSKKNTGNASTTNNPNGYCDFSNVWKLIVTGHMALPLLSIPLVFILIPSARICDTIDEVDGGSKREDKDKGPRESLLVNGHAPRETDTTPVTTTTDSSAADFFGNSKRGAYLSNNPNTKNPSSGADQKRNTKNNRSSDDANLSDYSLGQSRP